MVIVTMFDDDSSIFQAMRAGARGYVLKDAQGEDILRAILAVAAGEAIFGPAVARRIAEFFASAPPPAQAAAPTPLSPIERLILDLLGRGRSHAEVARELDISADDVAAGAGLGSLTPREREVADLVAQGRTNREIADALVISERTVEAHVSNCLAKLRLRSRAQLAVWAAAEAPSRTHLDVR